LEDPLYAIILAKVRENGNLVRKRNYPDYSKDKEEINKTSSYLISYNILCLGENDNIQDDDIYF
jgi:hypothetical protein